MRNLLLTLMLGGVAIAGCGAALNVTITAPTTYGADDTCAPGPVPIPADSLGVTVVEGSLSATGPWTAWASLDLAPGQTSSYSRTVPTPGELWYVRVTATNNQGQGCPVVISKRALGKPAVATLR